MSNLKNMSVDILEEEERYTQKLRQMFCPIFQATHPSFQSSKANYNESILDFQKQVLCQNQFIQQFIKGKQNIYSSPNIDLVENSEQQAFSQTFAKIETCSVQGDKKQIYTTLQDNQTKQQMLKKKLFEKKKEVNNQAVAVASESFGDSGDSQSGKTKKISKPNEKIPSL